MEVYWHQPTSTGSVGGSEVPESLAQAFSMLSSTIRFETSFMVG